MAPQGDYAALRDEIRGVLKQKDYDDGSCAPVLLRLAWHASGTYDVATDTGGSEGAGMRWEQEGADPSNAGLEHARAFLQPIKEANPWISYSDLWVYAGVVALEAMGGPLVPWKPGRRDFVDESFAPPRGRLPDASLGNDHLRQIFYRMGFNDQEIVALSGAHSLGRCHSTRSGFEGPWTVTPTRFSNMYYKMLTKYEWQEKKWDGPKQFRNDDLGEELMMLPTDLSLISDPSFRPWVDTYAESKELFFEDFKKAFAKLIELGVRRADRPAKGDKVELSKAKL
ncbi:hypothetical protein MNV49_004981 [Pseudohyphozyma bogoriensis]|nr:hypothetical protein MNV49_004981 [Pseudohyphozyma bogoriensis]